MHLIFALYHIVLFNVTWALVGHYISVAVVACHSLIDSFLGSWFEVLCANQSGFVCHTNIQAQCLYCAMMYPVIYFNLQSQMRLLCKYLITIKIRIFPFSVALLQCTRQWAPWMGRRSISATLGIPPKPFSGDDIKKYSNFSHTVTGTVTCRCAGMRV